MTSPIVDLEIGLYNKLANDSTLTTLLGGTMIYNKIAPPSAALPVVVFQWQGGGDDNLTPSRIRSPVYTVKAISASQVQAGSIDGRVDALLHHQTLTVSGYTNFWTAREEDVSYAETDESGNPIYHVGGMYKIRIGA